VAPEAESVPEPELSHRKVSWSEQPALLKAVPAELLEPSKFLALPVDRVAVFQARLSAHQAECPEAC